MMSKKEKIEVVESTCAVVLWTVICFVILCVFGSCKTSQNVEANGHHGGYIKIQK